MTSQTLSNTQSDNSLRRTEGELQPKQDLVDYAKAYARQNPEVVALWCFGIGFIIGWKLKPW